jgi:2-oxoisovalerate dehydrogenase E1 component
MPIPEIQFLAYVHNAEDQIRGEAATLSYFSNGQYTNGMVIRVAGLAYQKGFGGHFHNDNSLAVFRDIPGLIIACPSKGDDAVMMFRACVEEAYKYGRVCIFIEPIALYNIRDLCHKGDGLWLQNYPKDFDKKIEIGEFNHMPGNKKLCIVSYANGYYLSSQAAEVLRHEIGLDVGLVDIRWLAPLKEEELVNVISCYENILIVDECRKTGSFSEALMSLIYERCMSIPLMKRICSDDVFIPLGDAANSVLVQTEQIVNTAKSLIEKS